MAWEIAERCFTALQVSFIQPKVQIDNEIQYWQSWPIQEQTMSKSVHRLSSTLLAVAVCMAAMPASAIESGTYKSVTSGQRVTAAVTGKNALIQLSAVRCIGEIGGRLVKTGAGRWQVRSTDGCRLSISKEGKGYRLSETNCVGFHGPMCSFDGVYSK